MPIANLASTGVPAARPHFGAIRPAAPKTRIAIPQDSLALSATANTLPMRHLGPHSKLDRQAIMARFADLPGSEPVVFLNYDETLAQGEAAPSWTATGNPQDGPLAPKSQTFQIVSSHANGNSTSALQVGFRLANTGDKPLTLTLSLLDVGPHDGARPKPYITTLARVSQTLTIPAGGVADVPIAATTAHPAATDPRDAARMVTFTVKAQVASGDPDALTVSDIARFPQAPAHTRVHDAGGIKHHEGVFLTQQQTTAPPLLSPDNLAYIKISGSNAHHDAHYYAQHRALVAIPAGHPPKTLVFMGPGGMTHPLVGDRQLPSIGDVYAGHLVTIDGKSFEQDSHRKQFTIGFSQALEQGYLKPTGTRDPHGNSIYEIDVRFVAGDNGDLGVYARW